jgi:hypothetical protein
VFAFSSCQTRATGSRQSGLCRARASATCRNTEVTGRPFARSQ